ncbi:MAG: glycoside-pentoside-hexuronide (GPH):cation symporter [Acutalibacteraceae bacterium]|nr:glycoside-pentoside-hexuronide (GPH):cation symporter [Acutalibacteraceae bacterium]
MENKKVKPFGIKDKLGYLFGDFGNDFTFILSSSFLLKFYTDVMGVEAAVVGIVMMVARFVDAFTDVAMGRICDRSKFTKHGKFKPWIRRMCGPVAIASFLIYQSSLANLPSAAKIAYLFVTYILWGSVFYTSINIPYGSMASAISNDPGDRQSLSTFRTMGGMLAGAFVSVGIPMFVYDKIPQLDEAGQAILDPVTGEALTVDIMNGGKFTLIAGIFSVLAVICYLLCFYLTTERVKSVASVEAQQNNNVFAMLKNAVKNRALISIIAASIVMLLAQLTMQQMVNYVFPDYYGDGQKQGIATLAMGAGMMIAAVISKPLVKKFGKAEVSIVSNLFAGIGSFILFLVRPQSIWVYVAFQAVAWLGLGVFSMVNWALITDVIDYSEIKNGIREDGSVYALYSFARKLGQAASSGLSGALLTMIGYNELAAQQGLGQTQAVKDGIFNISTLVPTVGFILLALILWFWYPLKKKVVEKNVEILAAKHASEEDSAAE